MHSYYLRRALTEDLSPSELLNVIRILCGKAPTHQGVDGENHYATVAMKERNKTKEMLSLLDIEPESNEDDEVEEIALAYDEDSIKMKPNSSPKLDSVVSKDQKMFDDLIDESFDAEC